MYLDKRNLKDLEIYKDYQNSVDKRYLTNNSDFYSNCIENISEST